MNKTHITDGIEIVNNNDFSPDTYYLLSMEWNYPTESGRDIDCDTYDTRDEALRKAREFCRIEEISVKRHGHQDMKDLDCTWGPYKLIEFIKENDPDKEGYMIVWDNTPSYYFKTRVVRMKLDKNIPFGYGIYKKDDKINCIKVQ